MATAAATAEADEEGAQAKAEESSNAGFDVGPASLSVCTCACGFPSSLALHTFVALADVEAVSTFVRLTRLDVAKVFKATPEGARAHN